VYRPLVSGVMETIIYILELQGATRPFIRRFDWAFGPISILAHRARCSRHIQGFGICLAALGFIFLFWGRIFLGRIFLGTNFFGDEFCWGRIVWGTNCLGDELFGDELFSKSVTSGRTDGRKDRQTDGRTEL
jgi:hypothetical protein